MNEINECMRARKLNRINFVFKRNILGPISIEFVIGGGNLFLSLNVFTIVILILRLLFRYHWVISCIQITDRDKPTW